MKSALRYTGLVLLIVGFTFMPIPVTDPKAVISVFPWIAWSGALVREGAWLMGIGSGALGAVVRASEPRVGREKSGDRIRVRREGAPGIGLLEAAAGRNRNGTCRGYHGSGYC